MQFNYRPDIQGLRALAVLLVFFAHSRWSLFTGGFTGVDVFFVISGYVITQLLLREYHETGAMLLHRFYARRLQRLLPALAFMLLTTTLVSLLLLTPGEQLFQYGGSISATFWSSNIYFLFSDIDYFGYTASDNLYLHTWSLGVEEQFYLVWPIIILAGLGYFSKKEDPANRLIPVLVLTLIITLVLNLFLSHTSANRAFYLMPSRAWQFALGALVAYSHINTTGQKHSSMPPLVTELLAIAGLFLILLGAVWFDRSTPYPNWQVLVPSIGATLLLLAYHAGKTSLVGKALSLKPLRWLGDVSYSFYLWHWPILFFCDRLKPFYPGINTLLAFSLTIIMATLSCYVIENPIRKNKRLLLLPKQVVWGALATMLLVCSSLFILKSTSDKLSSDPEQLQLASIRNQLPVLYQYGCDEWYFSTQVRLCIFGDKTADKKAVLIGDSILMQWFPAIADYFVSRNWQFVALTKSSCPMVNRSFFLQRINNNYQVCDIWREQAIKTIIDLKPRVVIMGSSSDYPFSRTDWQDGTRDILNQLVPHIKDIKLIAGTPNLGFDGPACLARRAWLSRFLPDLPESSCTGKLRRKDSWNWLGKVAAGYPSVEMIELSESICPNHICPAKINDMIVYRDNQHLTVNFVMSLKEQLGKQLYSE